MSSLHESTDPAVCYLAVCYLRDRAEKHGENGEHEVAQALLEAARHVEGLARASTRGAARGTRPPSAEIRLGRSNR